MKKDCHTISMASSKYTWADVDRRVKQTGKRNRSQYISSLVEKDLDNKRNITIIDVAILLLLAVIVLEILLLV